MYVPSETDEYHKVKQQKGLKDVVAMTDLFSPLSLYSQVFFSKAFSRPASCLDVCLSVLQRPLDEWISLTCH